MPASPTNNRNRGVAQLEERQLLKTPCRICSLRFNFMEWLIAAFIVFVVVVIVAIGNAIDI